MFWYIIMLCSILAAGSLSYLIKANHQQASRHAFYFCCIVLLFFAAMRAVTVGADTRQYQWVFQWMHDTPLSQIPSANAEHWYAQGQELFYKYYNKILSIFGRNAQIITISNSLLQIALIAVFIRVNSPNCWLSIFLYFTLGFYQTALNLTPSSIASYLCLIALSYARRKKLLPYFAMVGTAALFHNSAILFFPIYFLMRIRITAKRFWAIITVSALLISFFFDYVVRLIALVTPAKYMGYLSTENGLTEQLLVCVSHLILFLFCWLCVRRVDQGVVERNHTAFLFMLIEIVFYLLGMHLDSFSRAAFLFTPYIIVAVPQMINGALLEKESAIQKSSYIRYHKNTAHNKMPRLYRYAIVIAGLILYIGRISINNIGTTMPYAFWGGI